jgi:hypothetical protein
MKFYMRDSFAEAMAVTKKELEELVSWVRSSSRRVRVRFRGYRYTVVIGRYVEAADPSGRIVPWISAFGSRAPHDVLSTLPVEEILVEEGGALRTFASIEELLAYAGIKRARP